VSPELAVETRGLTKQYRTKTALLDCTISVPTGRISALVGANGAGKSTLLQILTGLRSASRGEAFVLGRGPEQNAAFLADVGFLAQEIAMYKRFSAEDHIGIGSHLNPRWDSEATRTRLQALDIPLDQAVGTLSGGQRAQVALALALAKRPRLLLLDEPVAALDPLARRQFLASLAEAVADGGLTVLLSSHLVTDLERVCDHVVLLASAQPQLCGDIDDILSEHRILTGPYRDTTALERDHVVVENKSTDRQTTLVVRIRGPLVDPNWDAHTIGLEDLILAYMGNTSNLSERGLHAIGAKQ
jgi:ABC-2 type transport system ATP-binding protein